MPFTSKAQMRKFFAMEARGELPKGKAREWAHHTKNIKALPEHKSRKKKASAQATGNIATPNFAALADYLWSRIHASAPAKDSTARLQHRRGSLLELADISCKQAAEARTGAPHD